MFSEYPVVRKALDEWERYSYLSHEIVHAKSRFVNEFIDNIVAPKVANVEGLIGPSSGWFDSSSNRLDFIRQLANSDPDVAFEKAVYALSLANTAQLIFENEPTIRALKIEKRAVQLLTYSDKYYSQGKQFASDESQVYGNILRGASRVSTASQLDAITSPGERRDPAQLIGVSTVPPSTL